MAITHAIAHGHPGPPSRPSEMLAYLNRKLTAIYTTDSGRFVTALDAAQSLPLGVFEDEEYGDCSIQLRPRQNLLFYTDGITEVRSPQGEQFGPARLDAVCTDCAGDPINFFRRLSRPLKPSPNRPP